MSLLEVCEWLESTSVAALVRESLWVFPAVVATHILGLTVSVGTFVWFDLRLLGVSLRGVPVSVVWRGLLPWALTGFLVMFGSGAVLFTGFATAAYDNMYFRIKIVAILLAGLNAGFYHLVAARHVARWDHAASPPRSARLVGLTSVLLWGTVIVAGRMMSYTMF